LQYITTVVVYETEDSDFADSAIEALRKATLIAIGLALFACRAIRSNCFIHVRDNADLRKSNEFSFVTVRWLSARRDCRPAGRVTSIASGLLLLY